MNDTETNLLTAIKYHKSGALAKAEALFERILENDAENADAMHHLGIIAYQKGDYSRAINMITSAISIRPKFPKAINNLGTVLMSIGKLDEALNRFEKAITMDSEAPESYYNMGSVFLKLEEFGEAKEYFKKALEIKPNFVDAQNNLGKALEKSGEIDLAKKCYLNLLKKNPTYAGGYLNLGNIQKMLGQSAEAVKSFEKAIELTPDFSEAYNSLGTCLKDEGRLDEAAESYKKALEIEPNFAKAHNNLGNVLQHLGQIEEAIKSYTMGLNIKPDYASAHSNRLCAEQYRLGNDAQSLGYLHEEWDRTHGRINKKRWSASQNSQDLNKCLRVGFVSPDLGRHPVGYFILGLLKHTSETEIETICYSDRTPDDLTEKIKSVANYWYETSQDSDEVLTKKIISDKIDILIDLSGHSAKNRLLVFARKPAPIQITWAGYAGTTGLSAIDYLLSDKYSTPIGEEQFYTETIIRLPGSWLCYSPPSYAPPVGDLPVKKNGKIHFGSFCNPAKINNEVISLWAGVLKLVKGSLLKIKYSGIDSPSNIERLSLAFENAGLDSSRIILEGGSPHAQLLDCYNEIDIALDTFPYSGGLTTYEALWMGVPVITLPGKTFASRHSFSHLSMIGLDKCIAEDEQHYKNIAVQLASNLQMLSDLRINLRKKVSNSPICDHKRFAREFTTALKEIWQNWCLSISK